MKKWFRSSALFLSLFILSPLQAEVDIAPACRMKNRPPGRCGWCALETLGRHHQLKPLYDLTEQNESRACPEDLEAVLTTRGIAYRIQYPESNDTEILEYAVDKKLGAVVGFRELYEGAGRHIVTLVDFGPDSVRVIDCNDKDGRTRTMARDRFLYWWDGFALVPAGELKKK